MFRLFRINGYIFARNQHYREVVQNVPSFHLRFISKISESTNSQSPIVDFLITYCGLSSKKAISISRNSRVGLSSIENPNSVFNLLESNGFTKTQITKIVSNCPSVLVLDSINNLKPKIEFFNSLGLSSHDFVKLISSHPRLLKASLKDQIKPSVDFLKTLLHSDTDVLTLLKRNTYILRRSNIENVMGSNIATLQNIGVPKSYISNLLMTRPTTFMANVERFICVVDEIKQMGFDPSSLIFTRAISAKGTLSKASWEGKLAVYREFGFSEEMILSMFKKQPLCMKLSEEKIQKGLHFFMKQLKWDSTYISIYPLILNYSMGKRIIPRYSVLEILISEGFFSRTAIVGNIFRLNEKKFLEKFVVKYKESLPQVVKT